MWQHVDIPHVVSELLVLFASIFRNFHVLNFCYTLYFMHLLISVPVVYSVCCFFGCLLLVMSPIWPDLLFQFSYTGM